MKKVISILFFLGSISTSLRAQVASERSEVVSVDGNYSFVIKEGNNGSMNLRLIAKGAAKTVVFDDVSYGAFTSDSKWLVVKKLPDSIFVLDLSFQRSYSYVGRAVDDDILLTGAAGDWVLYSSGKTDKKEVKFRNMQSGKDLAFSDIVRTEGAVNFADDPKTSEDGTFECQVHENSNGKPEVVVTPQPGAKVSWVHLFKSDVNYCDFTRDSPPQLVLIRTPDSIFVAPLRSLENYKYIGKACTNVPLLKGTKTDWVLYRPDAVAGDEIALRNLQNSAEFKIKITTSAN